jgi:hypothetical protein
MLAGYIKYWRIAVAAFGALVLVWGLPKSALGTASQELLAFFGLLMAGVLPTMVLAASSLRSGALSRKRIQSYYNALVVQMRVWAGLFILSLLASLAVIIGKIVGWTLPLTALVTLVYQPNWLSNIDVIYALNFIVLFCLFLLASRVAAIISGLRSLLRLSAEIAMSEADERSRLATDKLASELRDISESHGRGEYVDLSH